MICYNLYSGWRFMQAFYRTSFPEGMNAQRFYVLMLCEKDEGVTVSEIAEAIQIDLPAVSALLGRMEKSGLIQRQPSPRNRREVLVVLTDQGLAMRDDINGRMGQIRGRLMEQVTQTDMSDLQDLVGRIKKLIQR
jgi:DNA-binding MarR family transcriptional regulator